MPKRRGLDRYIKKKGKAPLETYVPAVLQARGQMLKAGDVMGAEGTRVRKASGCCRSHMPSKSPYQGLGFGAALRSLDPSLELSLPGKQQLVDIAFYIKEAMIEGTVVIT